MRKASSPRRLTSSVLTRRLAGDVSVDIGLSLLILTAVYTAVDLVEIHAWVRTDDGTLFGNYFYKLPTVASMLFPSAAALGIGIRIARLFQSGELRAMESVGISPVTTIRRLLLVPLFALPLIAAVSLFIGPWGIARFETRLQPVIHHSSLDADRVWTRQPFGFLLFAEDGHKAAAFLTSADGGVAAQMVAERGKLEGDMHTVWQRRDNNIPPGGMRTLIEDAPAPPTAPAANNLWGQDLDWFALNRAILTSGEMGLSRCMLQAERALRVATLLACIAVPAGTAVLLLLLGIRRTGRAVFLGICTGAAYWAVCAAAWNGVAAGVLSDSWLTLGAPAFYSLLFVSLLVVWKYHHSVLWRNETYYKIQNGETNSKIEP